jgi:hypothetical protein
MNVGDCTPEQISIARIDNADYIQIGQTATRVFTVFNADPKGCSPATLLFSVIGNTTAWDMEFSQNEATLSPGQELFNGLKITPKKVDLPEYSFTIIVQDSQQLKHSASLNFSASMEKGTSQDH